MALKITYRGSEFVVPDGASAVIGADPEAAVRVARPGISRRHVVVANEDGRWVLEDAASKNGTYHEGTRVSRLEIDGPTTVRLGHPTEGETITLTPGTADAPPAPREATKVVTPPPAPRPASRPATTAPRAQVADPRLDELVATLADTVKAVRGLTFSVWAMIAITAVLALLTLFVGILGR